MKNFIIATAGHVDHGKTSLIKALTGKDCDTHPEEKKRGITIHLGFSHIKLSEDIYAGIVDVPGHKDFIDTMISGVNGIDLVLFIISADEGFMPQTYEHMQILDMLNIKKGIIIITKSDLVDEETLYYATEEIKEKVCGTFLENAEIIACSVVSGDNIDSIKPAILQGLVGSRSGHIQPKHSTLNTQLSTLKGWTGCAQSVQNFRYYPDRFFQVRGFGSVVTGTVLSGSLDKNKSLYIIPKNKELKIRKMEAYGNEVTEISSGQRASINITNFDKDDFQKGVMFCDKPYHTTSLIDVQLKLFDFSSHLDIWTTVEFYTATIQSQAKMHLIDKDKLFSGESCFAQLHLEKAVPLCFGDKFIIRNSSADATLGGGEVIDAFPLHHRRRTAKVKELLAMRVSGNLDDLICTEIEKTIKPISIEQISEKLFINLPNVSPENVGAISVSPVNVQTPLMSSLPTNYIHFDGWFWLVREQLKLEQKIIKYLKVAHKNNPLEKNGKLLEEFTSLVKDFSEPVKPLVLKKVLEDMRQKGIIDKRQNTYALTSHKVKLATKDHVQISWVDMFILNQRKKTPLWSELTERGLQRDIDEKKMKQILFYLIQKGRIVHQDGEYLHTKNVDPIREKLLAYLEEHPEGITVGQFRDLIDGNRKICIVLLNLFDKEGITRRVGDFRIKNLDFRL